MHGKLKALEDQHQLAGLNVSPRTDQKGISRVVDFSADFPDRVTPYCRYLWISLHPASVVVPGENLSVAWTMPLLYRVNDPMEYFEFQISSFRL